MMENFRIVGPELDPANVAAARQRNWYDEIPEQIRAARHQLIRLGNRREEVRLSELPALGPDRHNRPIGGASFRRPLIDPLLNQIDLRIGQASLADEPRRIVFGQPRRHHAAGDGLDDLMTVALRVRIGEQAEGRTSKAERFESSDSIRGLRSGTREVVNRSMTRRAMLEQNRRDVLIERASGSRCWVGGGFGGIRGLTPGPYDKSHEAARSAQRPKPKPVCQRLTTVDTKTNRFGLQVARSSENWFFLPEVPTAFGVPSASFRCSSTVGSVWVAHALTSASLPARDSVRNSFATFLWPPTIACM